MGSSKTPVVSAVECNGKVVSTSSKRDGRHSQTFLCGAVFEKVSLLVTGEWIGYKGLGPRLAVCPGAPTRSARSIRTSLRASGRFTCKSLYLILHLLLVSDAKPEGGRGSQPRVGTAPAPPGKRRPRHDARAEDYPGEDGFAGAGQTAQQCQPSLQDDGLQPGQLLSVQGAVRQRRRAGIAGDQPAQADPEEPHVTGDRRSGRCNGGRAAGLGPGARLGAAEAARVVDLARRCALRVAAPRPDLDEAPPQSAGSQSGTGWYSAHGSADRRARESQGR